MGNNYIIQMKYSAIIALLCTTSEAI